MCCLLLVWVSRCAAAFRISYWILRYQNLDILIIRYYSNLVYRKVWEYCHVTRPVWRHNYFTLHKMLINLFTGQPRGQLWFHDYPVPFLQRVNESQRTGTPQWKGMSRENALLQILQRTFPLKEHQGKATIHCSTFQRKI